MGGSRKVCQRGGGGGGLGATFDIFFLMKGDDPNTTKSKPSSAFRWQADDGPTLNAGLVAL